MSFKKYFINKSPFLQLGDPLKELMDKLDSTKKNPIDKGLDLTAKYNPNEKGKSGTETLLNTNTSRSTKEEIKKGQL